MRNGCVMPFIVAGTVVGTAVRPSIVLYFSLLPAVPAECDREPPVRRGVVVPAVDEAALHGVVGEHVGVQLVRPVGVALGEGQLHAPAAAYKNISNLRKKCMYCARERKKLKWKCKGAVNTH